MRRIAVDWDGTLAVESWPQVGEWLPGAVDALHRLAAEYDEVVIFSCRLARWEQDEKTPRENFDQIALMEEMLTEAKLPRNVCLWLRDYKPLCVAYLDDRAIEFKGDWEEVLTRVA